MINSFFQEGMSIFYFVFTNSWCKFFNFVMDIYNINNYCLKSISLDGKLRLWNIPEKKVALWNEVETGNNSRLITAVNFIQVSNKISHY